jgi:hypothetical protein
MTNVTMTAMAALIIPEILIAEVDGTIQKDPGQRRNQHQRLPEWESLD